MQPAPERHPDRNGGVGWVERALGASLALVIVPVVVLLLAALGAFAYGTDVFFGYLPEVLAHPLPVGNRVGHFLLIIDLFLIGGTTLIGAIGFYELFIGLRAPRRIPPWLRMHDLNDLKARVIAMVVLVIAVSFVELLVNGAAGLKVLEVGGGVAVVIVALTVFMRYGDRRRPEGADVPDEPGRRLVGVARAAHPVHTGPGPLVEDPLVEDPLVEDPLVERIGDRVGDVQEDG